jgi:RNA polymerase sigma-70 factor (ECF subfamily)
MAGLTGAHSGEDSCLGSRYDHGIVAEDRDRAPEPEIDDHGLMLRIGDRDEEALRMLYERHAPVLLAICLRIVGDRAEAEQVLLDVFWETWDRAQRYDAGRSAPLTYLTLLARSRALDARRRRKSSSAMNLRDDLDDAGKPGAGMAVDSPKSAPLTQLLAVEQAQSLRDALMSLEADERSLIEACFYDGYTHAQLAAKLEQPLGTIKTRIRRGLARLRVRLGRVFDEPRSATDKPVADESEVR